MQGINKANSHLRNKQARHLCRDPHTLIYDKPLAAIAMPVFIQDRKRRDEAFATTLVSATPASRQHDPGGEAAWVSINRPA
jgi:hypothetical protein